MRPCASDPGEGRVVDAAADIDATDFGAERAGDRRDADAVVFPSDA
jgi:hypothetical protein